MAVTFDDAIDTKRDNEFLFWPEEIEVRPKLNGRAETPDIEWLIKSILSQGQLQACKVRREDGKPVLALGYSRWRAISTINKKQLAGVDTNGDPVKIRVRCTFTNMSEQAAFVANIHENKVRNATTPLDDAHNIAQFRKWGWDDEKIAAEYSCSKAWVNKTAKLVTLEPEAQKAIAEGKFKMSAAQTIAKMSAEQQRETIEKGSLPKKPKSPAPSKGELKSWLDKPEVPDQFKSLLKFFLGLAPRSEAQAEFDWIPNKGKKDAKKES